MDIKKAAAQLLEAEQTKVPIAPLTELYPEINEDDAYAIQLEVIQQKVSAGAKIVGKKIGLTSKAMQNLVGVDEPDYGHILDNMLFMQGDTISLDKYIEPKVEFELGFILNKDLDGPDVTVIDVIQATDYIVPAFEIIDSRIEDWKIKYEDTVADNGSSAGALISTQFSKIDGIDLGNIGMTVHKNGEFFDTGSTGAILGNPLNCVVWLANSLLKYGVKLKAGELILAGAVTAATPVEPGDSFTMLFDHLGQTTIKFV